MRKYIFIALALLAIACTKEDVELQPATPQILNITGPDAPVAYDATRAEQQYMKTNWEAGDELFLAYIEEKWPKDSNGYYSQTGRYILTQSFHILTYDGSKWSANTPIEMPHAHEDGVIGQLCVLYNPGFEIQYNSQTGYTYTLGDPVKSEFLYAINMVSGTDHKIDLGNTIREEAFEGHPLLEAIRQLAGGYVSLMKIRSNRIRINYKPHTEIKFSGENIHRCTITIDLNNPSIDYGYTPLDDVYTVTTDENGNAFIYLFWKVSYNESPVETASLTITDASDQVLRIVEELPTTGASAPYYVPGLYENAYVARAYSITIPYIE